MAPGIKEFTHIFMNPAVAGAGFVIAGRVPVPLPVCRLSPVIGGCLAPLNMEYAPGKKQPKWSWMTSSLTVPAGRAWPKLGSGNHSAVLLVCWTAFVRALITLVSLVFATVMSVMAP